MAIVGLSVLTGCVPNNLSDSSYTLYRDSPIDKTMRIHVATFDSKAGGDMNPDYSRVACEETASMWQSNDSLRRNWWCEQGQYRK